MHGREFKPGQLGSVDPGPQNSGRTSNNEERRQAGTPATLEGNIEKIIDGEHNTGSQPQAQAYPIRWLVSHYAVSAAVAGIIATELDMRGAR